MTESRATEIFQYLYDNLERKYMFRLNPLQAKAGYEVSVFSNKRIARQEIGYMRFQKMSDNEFVNLVLFNPLIRDDRWQEELAKIIE